MCTSALFCSALVVLLVSLLFCLCLLIPICCCSASERDTYCNLNLLQEKTYCGSLLKVPPGKIISYMAVYKQILYGKPDSACALEISREREDKRHDVAETVITLGLGLIQSRRTVQALTWSTHQCSHSNKKKNLLSSWPSLCSTLPRIRFFLKKWLSYQYWLNIFHWDPQVLWLLRWSTLHHNLVSSPVWACSGLHYRIVWSHDREV